jgi:DNA-binding transcriptional ArsR family regulator
MRQSLYNMRKDRVLDALLPKTRQDILVAALMQPERHWYASELARRMGVPPSSLQRELRNLTAVGILKAHRQGRMAHYQANVDSPIFGELRGLLLKTAGLVDVVADALGPLREKLRAAFIYGSVAAGQQDDVSDIDLLVVGTAAPSEVALPLRQAGPLLGREINATVYTPTEFGRKRAAGEHFLTQVVSKPKLFVFGSDDDLDTVAG